MHPFFADYLDRLTELHDDINQAIDGLPVEALDWSPGADMNPLCVLVTHVAGSQRYWIGDVVAGDPSNRDRAAEFRAEGLAAETLKQGLADALAHSRGVLSRLSLDDLVQTRPSPMHDRSFSVGWVLAHALEHTAVHLGHIQLMRQLWEQRNT